MSGINNILENNQYRHGDSRFTSELNILETLKRINLNNFTNQVLIGANV